MGGDSPTTYSYVSVFNALMERYENTVNGVFTAHTHQDQLIFHTKKSDQTKITNTEYISPSMTTYTNQNPSFRMYTMDSETNQVVDYTQYRLRLDDSNKYKRALWEVAYEFKAEYGLADTTKASMQNLL